MDFKTVLFDIVSPTNASIIIILNMIEIIFICKMKMMRRKKSTVFLVNLAISDLILGLIIVLVKILSLFKNKGAVFTLFYSFTRRSGIQITLMASVLTNNILTTERFLAVKHPHVYNRITRVMRRNMCLVVWLLAIAITLCFYLPDPYDLTYRYHEHFIILSSIVILSLPWPIISYTMIRRVFIKRFTQKRCDPKLASSTNVAFNNAPRRALFADGKRFLVLCLRSFAIFVICWLPFAAFGCFIFIARDVSLKTYWLFPLQYAVHLLAFINSTLNPILYLYTYSFRNLVQRHFRSRRENKLKSTITIQALRDKRGDGGSVQEIGTKDRTSSTLSNTVSNSTLTSTASI